MNKTIPEPNGLSLGWLGWAEHLGSPGHGQIIPGNLRSVYLALGAALGDDPVIRDIMLEICCLPEQEREAHAAAMLMALDSFGDAPAFAWERSLAARTYDQIGCPVTITPEAVQAVRRNLAVMGREGTR